MTPEKFNGYIKCAAVFQKFICQSISANFSYNPEHFENNTVDVTALMNHTALAAKYGIKTRYYVNTKGEDEDKVEKMIAAAEAAESEASEEIDDSEGGCDGACKI